MSIEKIKNTWRDPVRGPKLRKQIVVTTAAGVGLAGTIFAGRIFLRDLRTIRDGVAIITNLVEYEVGVREELAQTLQRAIDEGKNFDYYPNLAVIVHDNAKS